MSIFSKLFGWLFGGQKTYVVKKGDTLSHIAQDHYGDGNDWQRIFNANKDKIKDPDLIYPGQVLRIPRKS